MDHKVEQSIIRKVQKGNHKAYATLVDNYQTPIYNLMLRMTRSEDQAFDLAQETFIRAYEKITLFDSQKKFFPWLYAIGINIAKDYLRQQSKKEQKTQSLDELEAGYVELGSEDQGHEQVINRNQLAKALNQLNSDTREALVLRYREQLSFNEIAETLDISLSSAKMKIKRGLEKMRLLMPELGG